MFAIMVILSTVLGMLAYKANAGNRYAIFLAASATFFLITLVRQVLGSRTAAVAPPPDEANGRRGLIVALAAGALAYASSFSLYFICDDFERIWLGRQSFVAAIWPQFVRGQLGEGTVVFYRPLGFITFFIDSRLWKGWAPGYHFTSVLLHLICIAGLFFLAKLLTRSAEAAGFAALFFAVLPINVEAVSWIICRFDLLAAAGMIWGTYCYARFRTSGQPRLLWYIASLLLFVLATLSKENAYALPLLWLGLELVVWRRPAWKPILGFLAVAALSFWNRMHAMGGLGGYRLDNGKSAAAHITGAAVTGIFLRAPGQTLFGYNWLQPAGTAFVVAAAMAAGTLVTWAICSRRSADSTRLIWLYLLWIVAPVLPAHFYFWSDDVSVYYSRVLYFSAAGSALLLGTLAAAIPVQAWVRRGWAVALGCLFLAGVAHNLMAWRWVSDQSRNFVRDLRHLEPSPPAGAVFEIENLPLRIRGLPFSVVGLASMVQVAYDRADLRTESTHALCSLAKDPQTIRLRWQNGLERPEIVALHAMAYVGADRQIHVLSKSGPAADERGWEDQDINGIPVFTGSHLAAYLNLYDDGYNFYYQGTDGHIHDIYHRAADWRQNDVTAAAAAPPAAPGTPLAGVNDHNGAFLYYLGENRHVYEFWFMNETGWHFHDATFALPIDALAATGSPLAIREEPSGQGHRLYYDDSRGHIHELYWDTARTLHTDLTASAVAPPASVSALASAVGNQGIFVYYIGNDAHIYELHSSRPGGWSYSDVTKASKAGATPGSSLAAVIDGNESKLYFQDREGRIHELARDAGGFRDSNLSSQVKAPPALDGTALHVELEERGPAIDYIARDRQIYQLYQATGGWTYRKLTPGSAPPAGSSALVGIQGYCPAE